GVVTDANSPITGQIVATPITGQIVAIGRGVGTSHDPYTSMNEQAGNTSTTSLPNEGNPDKLQMTIEALKTNPHITDEALAEYLSLKRPASARFWRLKAIEILNASGRQGLGSREGQSIGLQSSPWTPPAGVTNGK